VSFHLFLESHFVPANLRNFVESEHDFPCKSSDQLRNFPHEKTFKATHNLGYPVNVGRNLAREAALTHFVLASDIELYPSPGLVDTFFEMIQRNPKLMSGGNK
jgi:beta-1,4-glucuronyltransferase 1